MNILADSCSGVQNKIEASQQNRPFSERNNILTCEAAVIRPAVTPPPGTTNAGRSSIESIKLLVLTNICEMNSDFQDLCEELCVAIEELTNIPVDLATKKFQNSADHLLGSSYRLAR